MKCKKAKITMLLVFVMAARGAAPVYGKDVTTLAKEVEEAQASLDAAEALADEETSILESLKTELKELKAKKPDAKEAVREAEADVEANSEEIARLTADAETQKSVIESASVLLAATEETAYRNELRESAWYDLLAPVTAVFEASEKIDDAREAAAEVTAEANRALEEAMAGLGLLTSKEAELTETYETARGKLSRIKADIRSTKSVIAEKEADVLTARNDAEEKADTLEELKSELSEARRGSVDTMVDNADVYDVDSAYAFLRDCGFTHAAACGIMGNIKAESEWSPTCGYGKYYGLTQKEPGLFSGWCQSHGYSYSSMSGQMAFLVYDLKKNYTSSWGGLYKLLINDAYSAAQQAEFFCVGYERCVGGSDTYNYKSIYWPYSSGTTYRYQALKKRVNAANTYDGKYSAYADDWSALR